MLCLPEGCHVNAKEMSPREMDLRLEPETVERLLAFYRDFRQAPELFAPGEAVPAHFFDEAAVRRRFARQSRRADRVYFAVLHGDRVIGEVVLKGIDPEGRTCELGICLVNDEWKNRGFGTRAERLAVRWAFERLDMDSISAEVLPGNARSRRVQEKLGFQLVSRTETGFLRYVLTRERYAGLQFDQEEGPEERP